MTPNPLTDLPQTNFAGPLRLTGLIQDQRGWAADLAVGPEHKIHVLVYGFDYATQERDTPAARAVAQRLGEQLELIIIDGLGVAESEHEETAELNEAERLHAAYYLKLELIGTKAERDANRYQIMAALDWATRNQTEAARIRAAIPVGQVPK